MEIRKTDIAVVLAGHDKGRKYLTVDVDGGYALIVNGRTRKAERPKRKNIKHISYVCAGVGPAVDKLRCGEKAADSEIRRTLAMSLSAPAGVEGGM